MELKKTGSLDKINSIIVQDPARAEPRSGSINARQGIKTALPHHSKSNFVKINKCPTGHYNAGGLSSR
jgi:hypothetical protein